MYSTTSIHGIRSIFIGAIIALALSFVSAFIPGSRGDTIAREVVPKYPYKTAPLPLEQDQGVLYEQRLLIFSHPTFFQRFVGASNNLPGMISGLSPFGMLYFLILNVVLLSVYKNITPANQLLKMISIIKTLMQGVIAYLLIQLVILVYMSHVVQDLTNGRYFIERGEGSGYFVISFCVLATLLVVNIQKTLELQKEQELTI
jgi:hypothetical protein